MIMVKKEQRPEKVRGKWSFLPELTEEECIIVFTEKDYDNARRAAYWYGLKPVSRKTAEGYKIWITR